MEAKGKYELMNDMVRWFINKYGYDTVVELKNEIDLPNVYDVGTPSITKIKVVSGDTFEFKTFPYKRLHFYVNFYGWGWTDDATTCWSKDWKEYLDKHGLDALADALDLRIVKNITYTVKEKKK